MVHLIDATHVSDGEVKDAASLGHATVEVSGLVDDDLDLFGFFEICLDGLTTVLAVVECLDQLIVIQDGVRVRIG